MGLLDNYSAHDITVLLRPETDTTPFLPLKVGIQTATTQKQVEDVARHFDVVIHEASASNVEWIKGLITGLEDRAEKLDGKGMKPIFMYGGGTGVMADGCHGDHLTDHIWSVSGSTNHVLSCRRPTEKLLVSEHVYV
jgi:hypothetical protein